MSDQALAQALAQLAKAVEGLEKRQKDISGTPDAQLIFGPGGLFSNYGLDNTVVNLSITPRGISDLIPAYGTVITDPVFAYLTGFEPDGGAEPDGPCDDAPGGVMETAHQVAQFGRIARASKEMEVNQLMQILNGHLTTDLRLLGDVVSPGHALMPQAGMDGKGFLKSVMKTQLAIIGIEFQRKLSQMIWSGDPANNTNGGYAEFPGLDMLISTGKVDAFTGVLVPSLDSDIKDFGYNAVDSEAPDILEYLSMMMFYLQHTASGTNLDPVDWVLVMRPELFFELTAVWPCRYLTNRCTPSMYTASDGTLRPGGAVVINDTNNVAMRDEMRNGMFLYINGIRVPVRTDDGIPEDNSITSARLVPGEFASDIYILPLRAKGMPVLYWEYLDYTGAMADVTQFTQKGRFWTTDGGRYMWTLQDLNYCFKVQGKIEPRVILRTPQLAGKIQNVKYSPLQKIKSPFPESPYFVKGGNEEYSTPPTYYSEWNEPQKN